MRTTVRVPLATGVGAIVFDANSEEDVILISVGDGPTYAVKARELAHAWFLLASAVKVEEVQVGTIGIRPRIS
jgi:hypothetical protein